MVFREPPGRRSRPSARLRTPSWKNTARSNFLAYFSACGMAARSWSRRLGPQSQDAQGLQRRRPPPGRHLGALPLLVLDVYEHAYFIDYGSDRKAYIAEFWKHVDWNAANERFSKAKAVNF